MELSEFKKIVDNGKIFSVRFIKRTDGTVRNMVARTRVHSEGSGRNWNPDDLGLLCVYDMKARGFRHVPVENILRVTSRGKTFITEYGKLRA